MANVIPLLFTLLPTVLVPCLFLFLVAFLMTFLNARLSTQRDARCICKRQACQQGHNTNPHGLFNAASGNWHLTAHNQMTH